jgi:hypothetical protein
MMKTVMKMLFLLQSRNSFRMSDFWKTKEATTVEAVLFIVGVVIIVAVFIVVITMKKRGKIPVLNEDRPLQIQTQTGSRHYSAFTLHRLAGSAGLNREQIKMLDFVFKNDAVTDVKNSFYTPSQLDRHFKHAFQTIERSDQSEEEVQQRLSLLFSTRNAIEANAGSKPLTSTRQISENAEATLIIGEEKYPVKLVAIKDEYLVIANPKTASGALVAVPHGEKVAFSFFSGTSIGGIFESRVTGNATSPGVGAVLQLAHSSQIKQLAQRKFRRKQIVLAADFFLVYSEGTGKKDGKKMIVDKQRLTGNISDISAGGCSIKTMAKVSSGVRLKVEFTQGKHAAAALGQVIRTNRNGNNTIIHIKFLKVPRKSMNIINALVFDYEN